MSDYRLLVIKIKMEKKELDDRARQESLSNLKEILDVLIAQFAKRGLVLEAELTEIEPSSKREAQPQSKEPQD